MKRVRLTAILLMIIGLNACAGGARYSEMIANIPILSPELGRIYFYRPSAIAILIKPDVILNNEVVGKMVSQGFFYVDRQPGEYEVKNSSHLSGQQNFILKKGESRYIRFTVIPKLMFETHVTNELIDQQVAQNQIKSCRFDPQAISLPSAKYVKSPSPTKEPSANTIIREETKQLEPPKIVVRGEKVKVGVIEFQNLNDDAKNENLGLIFSEMLTTSFVNSEAFKITEREQLQKVTKELQLSQTGIIDVSKAKEVGKMVGADAIVTGSVLKIGSDLRLDARIIDVQSGIILSAEKIIGKSDLQSISSMSDRIVNNLVDNFYRDKTT